ncbi:MAG: hypothetical protein SNG49_09185 [Rikenellaceae bacterium]
MKIYNILLLCVFAINIEFVNATCNLNTNDTVQMQKLIKCLQSHKISFCWSNAQYQPDNANMNVWQNLPLLGKINEISLFIKSPERSGSFSLPKAQYFELFNDFIECEYEYLEPCKLQGKYKIKSTGLLELLIYDTYTNVDGVFSFRLYLEVSDKNEGKAFGEIWIGDSYKGKVRNISFTLIPLD